MSLGKNNGSLLKNSFEGQSEAAIHGLDEFYPTISKNVFINNLFAILIKFTDKSVKTNMPVIEFNDFAKNTRSNIYLENFPPDTQVSAPSNYMDSSTKTSGPLNLEPLLNNPQFLNLN